MKTKYYFFIIIILALYSCRSNQWMTTGTNIQNTNKGNVGIGISNPSSKLSVLDSSTLISQNFKWGISSTIHYPTHAAAIYGHAANPQGGLLYGGYFTTEGGGVGVYGVSNDTILSGNGGVFHSNGNGGIGVIGLATNKSNNANYGGWFDARSPNGVGIRAKGGENGYAAMFLGKIIAQSIEITGGADFSENFKIRDFSGITPESGMLASIDTENSGDLIITNSSYDKKIAGIISGAGGLKAGLILNMDNKSDDFVYPVALTGRVYCLVDASYGAIHSGDLLTSSSTPGYAMKVKDYMKAQGAIVGKAMTPLSEGKGLVLVLVTLQ